MPAAHEMHQLIKNYYAVNFILDNDADSNTNGIEEGATYSSSTDYIYGSYYHQIYISDKSGGGINTEFANVRAIRKF